MTTIMYLPDDEFYRSEEWMDLSADVMERDGFRCRVCGVTSDEKNLSVHHIIPRRYKYIAGFDIDSLANLLTLCWFHHNMADRKVDVKGRLPQE